MNGSIDFNPREFMFRLETLPEYHSSKEGDTAFALFRSGGGLSEGFNAEWSKEVKELRAKGVRVMRLRLVSNPLTDYERFELEAGYNAGIASGEEIRVAHRLDSVAIPGDFWVYDDQLIEYIEYGQGGEYIGSRRKPLVDRARGEVRFWVALFERSSLVKEYLAL